MMSLSVSQYRLSDIALTRTGQYAHSALSVLLYPAHFFLHLIKEYKDIFHLNLNPVYSYIVLIGYALLPIAGSESLFMLSFGLTLS